MRRQTSQLSYHNRLISITIHSKQESLIFKLLRRNLGHLSSQAKILTIRVKYSFHHSKIVKLIHFKRARLFNNNHINNRSLDQSLVKVRHRQHSGRLDNNRRLLLNLNSNQYLDQLLRLKPNKPFLDP